MVHNGIEYGDMQQICEAFQLMKDGMGMTHAEMKDTFEEWNKGDLDSYLIEITADILAVNDEDGTPLVEKVLDTAGQKGTGKWTGINALDLGIPLTLIGEAVFARCLSAFKDQRVKASTKFSGPTEKYTGDRAEMLNAIKDALYASKIVSYAQGYMLMDEAAREYGWKLNYSGIAMMWRGGCIIRSRFLGEIKKAFDGDPDLENLLLADFFTKAVQDASNGWRKAVSLGVELGVSMPSLSSALAFYDGYRSETLSANLLQAQRDYFGSHTYERVDKPRGEFFHTDWIKLAKGE
jgi:6-phosphogluconate dehydrogenase